eukprot:scaffold46095_cov70-Attheya_sp.AAC.12
MACTIVDCCGDFLATLITLEQLRTERQWQFYQSCALPSCGDNGVRPAERRIAILGGCGSD